MLEPIIERYKDHGIDHYFRGDASFAKPENYDYLVVATKEDRQILQLICTF